jgi:hypothetical protein
MVTLPKKVNSVQRKENQEGVRILKDPIEL